MDCKFSHQALLKSAFAVTYRTLARAQGAAIEDFRIDFHLDQE